MNPPDPLDRLVASWQEPVRPVPGLHRNVWRRIAAAEARRPAARLAVLRAGLVALFSQRAAIGWVLACVALGLLSAELRATRTPVRELGKVAAIYLQDINPLLRSETGGAP